MTDANTSKDNVTTDDAKTSEDAVSGTTDTENPAEDIVTLNGQLTMPAYSVQYFKM